MVLTVEDMEKQNGQAGEPTQESTATRKPLAASLWLKIELPPKLRPQFHPSVRLSVCLFVCLQGNCSSFEEEKIIQGGQIFAQMLSLCMKLCADKREGQRMKVNIIWQIGNRFAIGCETRARFFACRRRLYNCMQIAVAMSSRIGPNQRRGKKNEKQTSQIEFRAKLSAPLGTFSLSLSLSFFLA